MSTLWNQYVKYKTILALTDLETDDVITLEILAKYITMYIYFLVGEGNANMKYFRMMNYKELFGFKGTVLHGYGSEKDFTFDGEDIFNKSTCEQIRKIPDSDNNDILDCLKALIELNDLVILCLKPPRELIELWKRDKTIFNNIVLIGYMSFNIRSLFKTYSHEEVTEFLESFKQVIYYETFLAIGDNNSINKSSSFPFDKLPQFIIDLMHQWNADLYDYCKKRLQDPEATPEMKERNQKIIDDIDKSNGDQFVNADTGLVASLLMNLKETDTYTGKLSFNKKGYTVPIKDPNGKFIFINPIDKNEFLQRQMEFYSKECFS